MILNSVDPYDPCGTTIYIHIQGNVVHHEGDIQTKDDERKVANTRFKVKLK